MNQRQADRFPSCLCAGLLPFQRSESVYIPYICPVSHARTTKYMCVPETLPPFLRVVNNAFTHHRVYHHKRFVHQHPQYSNRCPHFPYPRPGLHHIAHLNRTLFLLWGVWWMIINEKNDDVSQTTRFCRAKLTVDGRHIQAYPHTTYLINTNPRTIHQFR